MKNNVVDAVNDQIQAEFASAYLYLAMSARFDAMNLKGFAKWLRVQWEEETGHALKLYDFLLQRDRVVALKTVEAPALTFETAVQAFEQVLQHEQYVTERINALYELALAERDYPLQTFLHWFINEQVEEESNAKQILEQLRMVGPAGLLMIDRHIGKRGS